MRYRKMIDDLLTRHKRQADAIALEIKLRKDYKDEFTNAQEAQNVLLAIAQEVQVSAHKQVSSLVTRCLAAIFDKPYEFKLEFSRKANKTAAKIVLMRDGLELSDPKEEAGIGVIDVASFALRLASLVLSQPQKRKLIIMDEPFKFLHSEVYLSRVSNLLETLAEELDVQFIIITQIGQLKIGKVINLEDLTKE